MRFSVLLIGIAALFVVAGPILASRAVADDWNTCFQTMGEDSIAACTRAISSRRFQGHELANVYATRGSRYYFKNDDDRAIADYSEAIRLDPKYANAYNHRGRAYYSKGDNDRAIADYDQAIRLDPKYPFAYNDRCWAHIDKGESDLAITDCDEAIRLAPALPGAYYNSRGVAYQAKGDLDRAIADYTEVIRLNPKYARAYRHRGLAHLYASAPPRALADISRASELDPEDAYTALWVDIIGQRNNVASRLLQAISTIDMTDWPAPVIRMFLDQMTPAAVLAAADNPDARKKKRQVCDANFYSGELALRRGAKDEAARLFRLAASDCRKSFAEWRAANAELKALGASP